MKKSPTTARTASWQYDSMDLAAGMNNKDHPSYKALSKYSGNPSRAPAGNPDSINAGRGSLKGNTNPTGVGPRQAPTSAVPDFKSAARQAFAGSLNAGSQDRTPGGVRAFDPSATQNYKGNPDRINEGRGPTRGNSQ